MGGAVFLSCWLFGVGHPALEPAGSWVEPGLGQVLVSRWRPLGELMQINIPLVQEFSGIPVYWTWCSYARGSVPIPGRGTKIPQAAQHGEKKGKKEEKKRNKQTKSKTNDKSKTKEKKRENKNQENNLTNKRTPKQKQTIKRKLTKTENKETEQKQKADYKKENKHTKTKQKQEKTQSSKK